MATQVRSSLLLDADAVLARLPSEPLPASPGELWSGISLRRYRHPPGGIAEVCSRGHFLVVHRSAGVSLEERAEGAVRRAVTTPGCVSLTPAGLPVSRRWASASEVLLIVLGEALVDEAARDLDADPARLHLVPRLASPDSDLDLLGRLILAQAAGPERGKGLMIGTLARALALHLVRRHSNIEQRPGAAKAFLPPRRVARVVEYMRAHLDQPIAIPELASQAGLSPSHLTRAFHGALGTTPHAYLVGLRLEAACDLLVATDSPITQIAFRCGFEQSQHFAATFRRRLGVTPTQWRRLRRR